MTTETLFILVPAVLLVAFLYSAVGHAGASGYIAVMALAGLSPDIIKPTALILNIVVAAIGSFRFWRAGHFSWRLFWPFALLSVPCAFFGGYVSIPTHGFKMLVGLALLCSAAWFIVRPREVTETRMPAPATAFPVGAGLGLLAGLTGTGGGIFLTPLVLIMRWTTTKTAAAVSALFILVNSVAGLFGNLTATHKLPGLATVLVAVVVAGGTMGSYLGSRRFSPEVIKRFLAMVLFIAGFKLILTH